MALIFKARAKADFDERQIALDEQFFSPFDPLPHQVLLRRHSRPTTKNADEVNQNPVRDSIFGKRCKWRETFFASFRR